jgi:hypothetical protein
MFKAFICKTFLSRCFQFSVKCLSSPSTLKGLDGTTLSVVFLCSRLHSIAMHYSLGSTAFLAVGALLFSKIALAMPAEASTITAESTSRPSIAPKLVENLRRSNPRIEARIPQGDVTPADQPITPVDGRPRQQGRRGRGITCDGRPPARHLPSQPLSSNTDFDRLGHTQDSGLKHNSAAIKGFAQVVITVGTPEAT